MPKSLFDLRLEEFIEPTSAFDEATRQIEDLQLGTTPEIWAFLCGPRGGTFAGDMVLETMKGHTLEGATSRTIARWRRWVVNGPAAAEMGCTAGTDFLTACIIETRTKGMAA